MTADQITQLASQSPVLGLTAQLGVLKEKADRELANFCMTLKAIDDTCDLLKGHGVHMTLDLGDVGNASQHARRAAVADKGRDVFTLPGAA